MTRDSWFEIEANYMHGWKPFDKARPKYPDKHLAEDDLALLKRQTSYELRIVKVSPLYDVEVVG